MSSPAPPSSDLPEMPLFSSLDKNTFAEFVKRLPLVEFEALDTIVKEGEQGDSFFIIVNGSVEVFKNEESLAVLEEGAFFGEMAILVPGPRQASVVAAEPCRLFEVSNEMLKQVKSDFPDIADLMMEFAEKRLINNLLLTSPLFKPFGQDDRQSLMKLFKPCIYEQGVTLIEEGERPAGLYMIVSGRVCVSSVLDSGDNFEVATLGESDIFGEISLLTRKPATATVRTLERCRLMMLPRERFNELIMTHPQVLELIATISDTRAEDLEKLKQRPIASSEGGGTALL